MKDVTRFRSILQLEFAGAVWPAYQNPEPMAVFRVEVQADFIKRLGLVRPIAAIAELVWNGLDADATEVHVRVESDLLRGVRSIEVPDNGTGMSHSSAREGFAKLGGSWKQRARLQ